MEELYDSHEDDHSRDEKKFAKKLQTKTANLKSMYLKLDKVDNSDFSSLSKITSPKTLRESVVHR